MAVRSEAKVRVKDVYKDLIYFIRREATLRALKFASHIHFQLQNFKSERGTVFIFRFF